MVVSRETLARYSGGIGLIVLATLIRFALDPILIDRAPLITYIFAVSVAAWLGGARLGLFVLVVGALVSDYFFIPPRYAIGIEKPESLLGLVLFVITNLIIIVLAQSQRSARERAERNAQEAIAGRERLEAEIAVRKQVEREREELLVEQGRLRAIAEEQAVTLASLLDQVPVGIVLLDGELRHARVNSPAASLTGRTPDQLVGRSLGEALGGFVSESRLIEAERLFRTTIETGQSFSAKGWRFRKTDRGDDDPLYIDWSIRRVDRPDGGALGILVTALDVSEDKRRELALRESEERFRLAAEAVNGLIYDFDIATGQVDRTLGLFELLGYRPEDVPSTLEWWIEQVHPDDRQSLLAIGTARIRVDGRMVSEYRVRHRDGREIFVLDRSLVATDDSGNVVRYVGCIQDVTEIRQAEQALREADRRKDDFLAVLAHELRNPLASIRNTLHLMRPAGLDQGLEPIDTEPERAMAERQVAYLARLIDDLMDISRINRGRIELRKQPIELAPILERAVESARSPLQERGHRLSVDLPEEPIPLDADPIRLEQVFGNLLNNAIKYTSPGGQVWLSASLEGGEVAVRLRDTGLGIAPEMLPRVFEMFIQDGHHAGHSQGGLGIGLGLSKTLVELHEGRISARSEGEGSGSEFEVRLPVSKVPTSRFEPSGNGRSTSGHGSNRRRVLIVDDNEGAARSLARILSRAYGQEVQVAFDGPSALQLADQFQPEVVLLDIGMPGMDGCEVARQLRSRPEFAETLVVALTGWGQEADRQRSEAAGINCHMVKPVDPDVLGDLIAGTSKV